MPKTPSEPSEHQACCSCLHVEYSPIKVHIDVAATEEHPAFSGMANQEAWRCRDCGCEFVRASHLANLASRLAAAEREREELREAASAYLACRWMATIDWGGQDDHEKWDAAEDRLRGLLSSNRDHDLASAEGERDE